MEPYNYGSGDVATVPLVFEGEIVEVKDPKYSDRPWKIIKVNPRRIKLIDEQGNGLSASVGLLTKSERTFTEPEVDEMCLGTVVEWREPGVRKAPSGKFVVIKRGSADGSWNVAKLGGDGNKYYSGVNAVALKVVDP